MVTFVLGEKPMSEIFPPIFCVWNSSTVHLIDNGVSGFFSSFQGRLSSACVFPCLSPPGINHFSSVMSLASCPQIGLKLLNTSDLLRRKTTCNACFAHQSVCSVISLHWGMSRARRPQWVFKGGCWSHASQGFSFHFSTFSCKPGFRDFAASAFVTSAVGE